MDDTGRDPSCVAVGSPSEDGCVKAPSTSAWCKVRRSKWRVGSGTPSSRRKEVSGSQAEEGVLGRRQVGPGAPRPHTGLIGPVCPLTLLQMLEVLAL